MVGDTCPACRTELQSEDSWVLEMLRANAKRGHPMALAMLANHYYYYGDTATKNKVEAARLYNMAVDRGQPEAMMNWEICTYAEGGLRAIPNAQYSSSKWPLRRVTGRR